jgi:CubicO group peptidase (beta-lactamase class C family)
VRILSEKTVAEMTKPRTITTARGDKMTRGYGWDIDSSYSGGPRGTRFAKGKSFGHTGYTGTSYWIDPSNDAFVIILTNRVHPDDDAEIKMLRKRIATVVGDALMKDSAENGAGPAQ